MELITNIYWKIFFSAYWVAYNMGEKKAPEQNANGFMMITMAINLFSLLFIYIFIIGSKPLYYKSYIISSMIFSFLFNYFFIYSKKLGYKTRQINYNYLEKIENKQIRNKTVLFVFVFTLLLMIITMGINNPVIKSFMFNK